MQTTQKRTNLLDDYIEHLRSLNRSQETISTYERILVKLVAYLGHDYGIACTDEDAHAIKGYMIDRFYRTFTTQSVSTKNLYVVIMQEFFKFLCNSGYMGDDPSAILKKEKVKKDDDPDGGGEMEKAYSAADVVELILYCGGNNEKRDKAIIATLTAGGFRASELCSMDIKTFKNMNAGRMYVKRKGGSWRWVTVADYAISYIEDYLHERGWHDENDPLFVTRDGKRLNRNTLWTILSRRQRELEMTTGVHILRHTFLTGAEKVGGAAVTKDLANHRSLQTTSGYIHTSADERREAANSMEWAKVLGR